LYQHSQHCRQRALADPDYPNNPDETFYWPVFGPIAAGNPYGDNYGGRVTGWIVAPMSGDYKFYLRSDDASELHLGTTEDPATLALIAEQTACCNAFTDSEGSLSSIPQNLAAGRRTQSWRSGRKAEGMTT
jgi:hypothetical protein